MEDIAVFGMGYVGCVTAACLARDGFPVIGVDIAQEKVDLLNSGRSPVFEPGLEDLVSNAVKGGKLKATTKVAEAVERSRIALIAVGTPSNNEGAVSSVAVTRVLEDIGKTLAHNPKPYHIVIRSTLLPGILEELLTETLRKVGVPGFGENVILCNNPEFLREGSAIKDYDNPPFVLVGAGSEAQAKPVIDLYHKIDCEKIVADTRTASLVKYACNAFHAAKVAFANEIGVLAKSFGADGHSVMDIVCKDRKLNVSPAYLRPGFAFGGSCLPKDLRALNRHAELQAIRVEMLRGILVSNDSHLARAQKVIQESGHRQIGLVGLSFKAGTDDLRESPLVVLAENLLGRGYQIKIYDPCVSMERLKGRNLAYVDQHLPHLAELLVTDVTELFTHSKMLVLGTNVADGIDWATRFQGPVFDLRTDLCRPAPNLVKS